MKLRRATPENAIAIAEIHLTARREAMPWLAVVHSDAETHAWVGGVLIPEQNVWVAEVDGVVVGYAAIKGAWLNDLYVRPGYQGQGVGSALLANAMELSPAELNLWTFQRNANARRFYERRGFAVVELTDGAGNEEREPDIRYRWVAAARDAMT